MNNIIQGKSTICYALLIVGEPERPQWLWLTHHITAVYTTQFSHKIVRVQTLRQKYTYQLQWDVFFGRAKAMNSLVAVLSFPADSISAYLTRNP